MATGTAPGPPPDAAESPLEKLPDELLLRIAKYSLDNSGHQGFNTIHSLRLACRRLLPIATDVFASTYLKCVHVVATKRAIEEATEILGGSHALGSWVEEVSLKFLEKRKVECAIRSHGNLIANLNVERANIQEKFRKGDCVIKEKEEIIRQKRELAAEREGYKSQLNAEQQKLNIPAFLALFPNMTKLSLRDLTRTTFRNQLGWWALRREVAKSGSKFTSLTLYDGILSTADLRRYLSIFPFIDRFDIVGSRLPDGYPEMLALLLLHGRLKAMSVIMGQRFFFLPWGSADRGEEFQKKYDAKYRKGSNLHIARSSAIANGAPAVEYVLNRLLSETLGGRRVQEIETAREVARSRINRIQRGDEWFFERWWRVLQTLATDVLADLDFM